MYKLYEIEGSLGKLPKNVLSITDKKHLLLEGDAVTQDKNKFIISTRRGDILIHCKDGIEITSDFTQDYVFLKLSEISKATDVINEFVDKTNLPTAKL